MNTQCSLSVSITSYQPFFSTVTKTTQLDRRDVPEMDMPPPAKLCTYEIHFVTMLTRKLTYMHTSWDLPIHTVTAYV